MTGTPCPDLAAIRARLEQATPGPWTREKPARDSEGWSKGVAIAATLGRQTIYANPPGGTYPSADAEFIAHAPEDVAALLTLCAQQAQAIERLTAALKQIDGMSHGAYNSFAAAWEIAHRALAGQES